MCNLLVIRPARTSHSPRFDSAMTPSQESLPTGAALSHFTESELGDSPDGNHCIRLCRDERSGPPLCEGPLQNTQSSICPSTEAGQTHGGGSSDKWTERSRAGFYKTTIISCRKKRPAIYGRRGRGYEQ